MWHVQHKTWQTHVHNLLTHRSSPSSVLYAEQTHQWARQQHASAPGAPAEDPYGIGGCLVWRLDGSASGAVLVFGGIHNQPLTHHHPCRVLLLLLLSIVLRGPGGSKAGHFARLHMKMQESPAMLLAGAQQRSFPT
jgi:hypothetical protein